MSDDVSAADWIRERLSPWDAGMVTSFIPSGFDNYARILHPVQLPRDRHPLIRWADVSKWSGVPLQPRVQWHQIALPETTPPTEAPWRSQGPQQGTLFIPDAEALIDDLTAYTSTAHECYFCLWVGYMGGASAFVPPGSLPISIPAPPQPSRLVELPAREYALFAGPLTSATSMVTASIHDHRTPNLWWPVDQSWCIASEIDLPWTYVGGSSELIERILTDERLEAVSTSPGDPIWEDVDDWLTGLIERSVDDVLATGTTSLELAAGTVTVKWDPARRRGRGTITTKSERSGGWSGGGSPVHARDPDEMRRQIAREVHRAVLSLINV